MKKIFAVLMVTLVMTFSENAQAQFGIKGGLSMSDVKYDISGTKGNFGSKTGMHIGMTYGFQMGDQFVIEPGLLYVQKGYESESDGGGVFYPTKTTTKLNYLEIPLLFKYNINIGGSRGRGPKNSIFIAAGPYTSFGVGGNYRHEIDTGGTEKWIEESGIKYGSDDSSDIKSLDFGIQAGIGFQMASGIIIGASYDLGLSNITPVEDLGIDQKNTAILVSLGYQMQGKKRGRGGRSKHRSRRGRRR